MMSDTCKGYSGFSLNINIDPLLDNFEKHGAFFEKSTHMMVSNDPESMIQNTCGHPVAPFILGFVISMNKPRMSIYFKLQVRLIRKNLV